MTSPDSPASMVSPQAVVEEVDLDSLPALPSLVQFTTRGLLLVTTATSVVVAILFGLYPTLFRCGRADVATAALWGVAVFIAVVLLVYQRRYLVEAKTGKEYVRVAWQEQLPSILMFGFSCGMGGLNLGIACMNFAERNENVSFAIMLACVAGFTAAVGFLHFAWGSALQAVEICETGITTHPLWFYSWNSERARSLELEGDTISVQFKRRRRNTLNLNANERAIVEAVLARHSNAPANGCSSAGT